MNHEIYNEEEIVDYKSIALPIGTARAQGPIENFRITIYDRNGNTYRFQAVGGNICVCDNDDTNCSVEYEVS